MRVRRKRILKIWSWETGRNEREMWRPLKRVRPNWNERQMGTELYRQKRTAEDRYLSIWECVREKVHTESVQASESHLGLFAMFIWTRAQVWVRAAQARRETKKRGVQIRRSTRNMIDTSECRSTFEFGLKLERMAFLVSIKVLDSSQPRHELS